MVERMEFGNGETLTDSICSAEFEVLGGIITNTLAEFLGSVPYMGGGA